LHSITAQVHSSVKRCELVMYTMLTDRFINRIILQCHTVTNDASLDTMHWYSWADCTCQAVTSVSHNINGMSTSQTRHTGVNHCDVTLAAHVTQLSIIVTSHSQTRHTAVNHCDVTLTDTSHSCESLWRHTHRHVTQL